MRRVKRVYDSPFRDHGGVHKGNDLNHLTPRKYGTNLVSSIEKLDQLNVEKFLVFSQEVRGWPLQRRSRMKNIRWKN